MSPYWSTYWTYDALKELLEDIKIAGIDKPPTPVDKGLRDAVVSLVDIVQGLIPGKAAWACLNKEYEEGPRTYQEVVVTKLEFVLWNLDKDKAFPARRVRDQKDQLAELIEAGIAQKYGLHAAPQEVHATVRRDRPWTFRSFTRLLADIWRAGVDDQPSSADPNFSKAVEHLVEMVRSKFPDGDKTTWKSLWDDRRDPNGYRTRVLTLKNGTGVTVAFRSRNYQEAVIDELSYVLKALKEGKLRLRDLSHIEDKLVDDGLEVAAADAAAAARHKERAESSEVAEPKQRERELRQWGAERRQDLDDFGPRRHPEAPGAAHSLGKALPVAALTSRKAALYGMTPEEWTAALGRRGRRF
ncbi:hypothetical protein JCM5296_003030 [Sporobolomyces johnsonii]